MKATEGPVGAWTPACGGIFCLLASAWTFSLWGPRLWVAKQRLWCVNCDCYLLAVTSTLPWQPWWGHNVAQEGPPGRGQFAWTATSQWLLKGRTVSVSPAAKGGLFFEMLGEWLMKSPVRMLSSTSLLLLFSPEAMISGGNEATGANYSLGRKFILCKVGGTCVWRERGCGRNLVLANSGFAIWISYTEWFLLAPLKLHGSHGKSSKD